MARCHAAQSRQHPRKGVWSERIAGRFRKITAHQLALAWWCHQAGHITRRQLRVWFAAHEMAERRRYTDPVDGPERPLYGLAEIKALVGGRGSETADADLSADVTRLARLGLVTIEDHAIVFAASVDQLRVDDVAGFWSMYEHFPHARRAVPVPRRMLRALAAGLTRGMTAVVLATLVRSLFWHKQWGAYRTDGRTKRQWVAEVFGVSPRTVTDARARLIELGWLAPIESPQWMLNRYGAHDVINTDWQHPESSGGAEEVATPAPVGALGTRAFECGSVSEGVGESASPCGVSRGGSASPDLNRSLPLTGNQKTRKPARARAGTAGVSLRSAEGGRRKGGGSRARSGTQGRSGSAFPASGAVPQRPTIRDIQPRDLADTGRLLELYEQAAELGLASRGEGGRLDFLALAERARSRGTRSGALFYWLLRERKTAFITQADEDEANRRLKRCLYGSADAQSRRERSGTGGVLPMAWFDDDDGRGPSSGGVGGGDLVTPVSGAPQRGSEQSGDDGFIVACVRIAKQHRLEEPWQVAKLKGWTKQRWDEAYEAFQRRQIGRWGGATW